MIEATADINARPDFDNELKVIAKYVSDFKIDSEIAYQTAYLCLLDTMGCGILALNEPECYKLLGPIVAGTIVPNGARVPGTPFVLDPVQASFSIGAMNRWLDYNDTWLAAEWGHPSDNLAGILAVADYLNREQTSQKQPLLMQDVLTAMIKAYEIQGVLALANSFNAVGLDHVLLVKVATTAVVTKLLGGNQQDIVNALSQAWLDGHCLRTYRHAPNTGSRKSWAAGDAASRGVRLALMTLQGEMGYPSALTAKKWGLYDVLFQGKSFAIPRPFASYVMENILFKVSYPAEFHAQTALECAIELHPQVKERIEDIAKIQIKTQQAATRIISKQGPLYNPADRDHCLQYIVAIGLLYGLLTGDHYKEPIALDPRIDLLRDKMVVTEEQQYSRDYLDPEKRSIANSIQVIFKDGSHTDLITCEYPLGHRRRRSEAKTALQQKFSHNINSWYSKKQADLILKACSDLSLVATMPVDKFMDLWVKR